MRAPILLAASVIASITLAQTSPDAQVRAARPRTVAISRPVIVSRPATVFVGGYYYPAFYRSSFWYDPWGPGYYGYYGYYGPGYGYYPYQVVYPGRGRYDNSGSVRLQISPREAEVFVDGYFAGTVDDFDGVFQRLNIAPGEHEIQVYLDGYRSFSQRFYLQPGKSFNIRHTMERLGPNEPASPRPDPSAGPGPFTDDGRGRGARGAGRGARGEGAGRAEGPGARGDGRGRAGGPAEGFGSLSLRVQPADAQVLIDGEPWNGSLDNGALIVQLGTGQHHVEIRRDGYRSYLTDVGIVFGQTRTLNVALTKQ